MDLLTKLSRAFDTKGYPDDKDPNHWRTIQHTHVHIDANGNIDGGAGQKFNGKAWSSQKHPHNPASYPKPAAPTPPPAPAPPPVTTQDLKNQWAKVVKYMVATKQGKSQATKAKHAQNLLQAINDYTNMRGKATSAVQATHNPKVQQALAFANNAIANPMGANVNHRTPQASPHPTPAPATATNPLQNLVNATAPQTQPVTNNLQSAPANGKVNKGRNVKIYNLCKTDPGMVQLYAHNLGLNASQYSDINALGKAVSLELGKRNANYASALNNIPNYKTMAPNDLKTALRRRLTSNKTNPMLNNQYGTQMLSVAMGCNNPPRIVSKADFDKMAKTNKFPVIYRGLHPSGGFNAQTIADDIKYGDANWQGGSACIWGVGLYMTTMEREANSYAASGSNGKTIRAQIDPAKAKVIDWDDLIRIARGRGITASDYYGGGGSSQTDQLSMLALQLGYNVIKVTQGNSHTKGSPSRPNSGEGDFYNVLDRGCLICDK